MHAVDQVLAGLGAAHRSPAPGEWGVTFEDVAGRPLHVGLREAGGLLRVQAEACAPQWAPDPRWLLHRNRLEPLVRYAHSSAGAVWVQCDLPLGAAAAIVERALAAVVVAAEAARSSGGARP